MVAFFITVLEAIVTLILAFLIFRSGKHTFANQSFSLFLVFLSLWILSGFLHLLLSNPGSTYITFQFRMANLTATVGAGIFCLFGLGFLKGQRPKTAWLLVVSLITVLIAIACATELVIKKAIYVDGESLVTGGPIYHIIPAFMLVVGGIGLSCVWIKRRRSKGTERARASYLFIGFSFILIIGVTLNYVIPTIMGKEVTAGPSFLLVIIPILLTGYAMLRHRLLDVRIAIRKTLAYIITLILFGAPIVVLYALLRTSLKTSRNIEITISVGILAFVIFLSPAVLRWTNKLSSRLFFAGLYDEVELLHQTSIIFSSTVDIKTGLIGSASLLCEKLKLQELLFAIPNEVTQQEGNWLIGSLRKEGLVEDFQETNSESSPLYQLWSPITIDDRNEDEETLAILAEMREQGLEACLPITGPAGKLGVLLVGEKLNRANLDPLDFDLLAHFAEQAGLFIENYLLSTYLLAQLEELLRTRSELQKADQFKTDIINVTSHELRTPLTILNSFTQILLGRNKRFNEAQRTEYLGYVSESCQRLNSIFNQFLSVSNLQEGQIEISNQAISLGAVFDEVCEGFGPEDNSRIVIQMTPPAIEVQSDHSCLSLMLKNLLENAIRFSSPEFPVVLSAEKNGNEAVISIRDSGEGIDAPDVQRIFSPFIRLEETDKHHAGTGLGLYLVRLIADLLKTSISVESQPNQGSLFRFSLPLAASEDVSEGFSESN